MSYEVEPHEVDALRQNLLGDILAEPDPTIRYHLLTREQAMYDALVSAIKRDRGEALAEVEQSLRNAAEARGERPTKVAIRRQVAEVAGLGTRQRVEQLMASVR